MGVLFDFGNTILREGRFDVVAGVEAVLREATEPPPNTAEELAQVIADLLVDLEPRRYQSQLEFPPYLTSRLVYEPRGIEFGKSAEELEWVFWRAATTWALEPGIADVLDALRVYEVSCGCVSNTAFRGDTLLRQLATSELDGPISWVIASADFVVRKPHRLLFDLARQRLGSRPEETWFVGDSYDCDIKGAASAGLVPIWYKPGGPLGCDDPFAACTIRSWSEFLELLDASMA